MGQGWPPGGPWITEDLRSKTLRTESEIIEGPAAYPLSHAESNHMAFAWQLNASNSTLVQPDSFVDISAAAPSGSWKVPHGKWLVGSFRVAPGGIVDKGDGPEVDPASQNAVRFHLNHLFNHLDPRLRRFYGATLVDVASDSWEYARGEGPYWSPKILPEFIRVHGYDLRQKMYVLLGYGPDRNATLEDLEAVEKSLVKEGFFDTAAEMLNARGLRHRPQVYGRGLARDFLQAYATADVPEVEQGLVLPEAVWASHTVGRRVTSAEAFTFLSQKHEPVRSLDGYNETTPALFRHASNYHFAEGINRLHFHSFPYSPATLPLPGWRMYAEIHVNRNLPWWPYFDHLTRWMRRNQWVLQAGSPVADVLVYPIESDELEEPYRRKGKFQPTSAANGVDGANRHTLPVISRRIAAGEYQCGSVCMLTDVIDTAEAADLLDIAAAAGRLICCQRLPEEWTALRVEGADGVRQQAVQLQNQGIIIDATEQDWREAVDAERSVRWQPAQHPLKYQHRRVAETDVYFLANFGDRFAGVVSFPATQRRVEIWDADSGEQGAAAVGCQRNERTHVTIDLDHAESTIVAFVSGEWPVRVRSAAKGNFLYDDGKLIGKFRKRGRHVVALSDGQVCELEVTLPFPIVLNGPWELQTPAESAISEPVAGRIELTSLRSWREIPELYDFAGTVRYETSIQLAGRQLDRRTLWELDLGDVYEVADLWVNGRQVATSWTPPHRLDVTEFLKPGRNAIRVDVANLLKNHLIQDKSYRRSSGLIGPVKLQPARRRVLHRARAE